MPRHQYNLGLIGNCGYLALIDDRAAIQWMCWPNFDSSFIFGGLLDEAKGGRFSITPRDPSATSRQYYLENTNILCTEFIASDGSFRVLDFAPRFAQYGRYFKPKMLVRKIELLRGNPHLRVVCQPVGEYGTQLTRSTVGSNHIRYDGLARELRLTTNLPLLYVDEGRDFQLQHNHYLVLTYGHALEAPLESTATDFLQQTTHYWHQWVKRCSIGSLWQQQVIRSALTLKMHQFEDTGAIIASATMGLPEHDGSGRNWDYRYCWMRDSYYTLKALYDIGQFDELEAYAGYISNIAVTEQGHYHPVYSIGGDSNFEERELDLAGYLGNRPVRLGNQAKEHIQNDVYGQLLVSLLPLYVDGRISSNDRNTGREIIWTTLRGIARTMDMPDAGLWEFRNLAQHHCYTFLFHWAGARAAVKIARQLKDQELLTLALKLTRQASAQIERCYDPALGSYTQAIGSKAMDASLLQLITMDYLPHGSPRARTLIRKVEEQLKAEGSNLFYRYRHQDDFGRPKSTFLVCAFWYAEALACVGRTKAAIRVLNELKDYANPLGLFSEDMDSTDFSQWGNFPQTYSHVGLITAASRIMRRLDRPLYVG